MTHAITVTDVIEQLASRRVDAAATLEVLESYRQQIDAAQAELENPQAVREYLEFFVGFVGDRIAMCERIERELPGGITGQHIDELRQAASNAAAEQRRCLIFRDRWINKPLPVERLRPLLNEISVTTRDQLTAFRDLSRAAERLQTLLPPEPEPDPDRTFDRRKLFTRFFKIDDKR